MRDKKNKFKNFSEDILRQYVTIVENCAIVDLYFESFQELIDQNLGNNAVEKLNNILITKINEMIDIIPIKYEVMIHLYIHDFGDYTPEETEKILQDNIALIIYQHTLERRRKIVTALSLLGGGIILLLGSYFLHARKWPEIIYNVINISGTLFVWEAANIGLIKRTVQTRLEKRYIKQFKGIKVFRI